MTIKTAFAFLIAAIFTLSVQSESSAQTISNTQPPVFGTGTRLITNTGVLQENETQPVPAPQSDMPDDFDQVQDLDEFEWADETLPDWLEEFGLEEEDSPEGEDLPSRAEQAQMGVPPNPFGTWNTPLRIRPTVTGDWCGLRTRLMQRGITYRGRATHYAFGVGGGVNEPIAPNLAAQGVARGDAFRYTGTSQHDLLVDLEKFGGPKAGRFVFTAENIYGTFGNVSLRTGALAPIFGTFMPADAEARGIPRITNFFYVQPLSKKLILGAGKLRLPGIADQDVFAGGDGSDQFVNQTFAVNPMFITVFPISTFAVTAAMPQEWGNITFAAMDPQERSKDFFDIGDVFSQGVILQSQVKVNTNFFDLPGDHHLGAIYKDVDLLDLSLTPVTPPYPTYPYPPAPPGFETKSESWLIYYGFDQYLNVFGEDARGNRKGWGFFGRAGLADGGTGNPNFVGWHASMGIGGYSPFFGCHERGDKFGFGYSFLATSDEWGPLAFALLGPRDYQAMEAYYSFQVTPAISITPDIQWIQGMLGGLTDFDDSLLMGVRVNVKL